MLTNRLPNRIRVVNLLGRERRLIEKILEKLHPVQGAQESEKSIEGAAFSSLYRSDRPPSDPRLLY